MGIADRDYARAEPEGTGRGARGARTGRVGRFGAMSVTGWLIAINVLVFLVGNVVLGRPDTRVSAGIEYAEGVSSEQKARSQVLPKMYSHPKNAGMFYQPIMGPAVDGQNRPLFEPRTGQPILTEIGRVRYLMQPPLEAWGHFSTGKLLELQVWRVVTFQFLHANTMHLVFNMLGLWFVGGLVEQYLGSKRYVAFYLLSGIFGALSYLILNLLGYALPLLVPALQGKVPLLLFDDMYVPLIGASAGVFGVLLAAAYIAPNAIVQVMFIIPMKLRTAVYLFVALATYNLVLGGTNAGGDAAHVGGAVAGAFFIRRTHLLREFFDVFGSSRLRGGVTRRREENEVDRILDKVRSDGIESLTEMERGVLRQASRAGG